MLANFNSYMSNNRNQKTSFGAIDPKHLKAAQDAVKSKSSYYFAVRDLEEAYGVRDISQSDALDTIAAIREIYPERFHNILNSAQEWITNFKFT